MTANSIVGQARTREGQGRDSGVTDDPFAGLAMFAYSFIMIDPPWAFKTRSDKGQRKSASQHYPTMTIEQISALPVAHYAAPDCRLFLWCTCSNLPAALGVLNAWGFAYSSMGFWHKRTVNGKTAFGTGYVVRDACEPFLLGRIGSPKNTRGCRNIIEGPVREHSRKPDEAYAWAEKYMPDARRADIFSRERRPGWDSSGNETGKFNMEAAA